MKPIQILLIGMVMLLIVPTANAQFKINLRKKVEEQAEKRANKKIDDAIDDSFDKTEDAVFGKKNKKDNDDDKQEEYNEEVTDDTNQDNNTNESDDNLSESVPQEQVNTIKWNKFDFVPGDEVIFEDMPSVDEENGEFPSRWDLHEGSSEIVEFNGEKVIMFLGNSGGAIVPYMKNSKEDYLPEIFTIEFDCWFEKGSDFRRYWIFFIDRKNQWGKGLLYGAEIFPNGIDFMDSQKRYPGREDNNWSFEPVGRWAHISIAYTNGKFKMYMDDTRLINIPHLEGNPWGLTINAERDKMYIKNIRIAKGGVKYYDRVLSDGKIIVNGIRFDINKTTLKPESIGPINKIYKLMEKQPDLKFSVEGHTDSDGELDANQKLSEGRAKVVMDKLIEMGISADRLSYKGFGESMPIKDNSSAEGKAGNRRVEFVKM